jgi:hypothetical protein
VINAALPAWRTTEGIHIILHRSRKVGTTEEQQ